jgi:hypothetical protein
MYISKLTVLRTGQIIPSVLILQHTPILESSSRTLHKSVSDFVSSNMQYCFVTLHLQKVEPSLVWKEKSSKGQFHHQYIDKTNYKTFCWND